MEPLSSSPLKKTKLDSASDNIIQEVCFSEAILIRVSKKDSKYFKNNFTVSGFPCKRRVEAKKHYIFQCVVCFSLYQYVTLRTRYSELMTLTSQYIKFITDSQRRLEDEEEVRDNWLRIPNKLNSNINLTNQIINQPTTEMTRRPTKCMHPLLHFFFMLMYG